MMCTHLENPTYFPKVYVALTPPLKRAVSLEGSTGDDSLLPPPQLSLMPRAQHLCTPVPDAQRGGVDLGHGWTLPGDSY